MEFRGVEEQGELQRREEASGGASQGRVLEGLRRRYLETEARVEGWRTRWEYGGAIRVKGSGRSPAHPALEVPLATTAVRSLELGVAAVTATHCVQLHGQLLGEATGSEPQQMRLWEAVGSFESNPKIHLRTGQGGIILRARAHTHSCAHTHTAKPLVIQNPT